MILLSVLLLLLLFLFLRFLFGNHTMTCVIKYNTFWSKVTTNGFIVIMTIIFLNRHWKTFP